MGLALPLALLGLLALAVPVWLHRIRRRQVREVPLPTLALLQKAKARKKRVLALRDVPLLMARLSVLLLVCLALAGPFSTGKPAYGTGLPMALAVVVDDSLSMHRQISGHDSVLDHALSRGRETLEGLAPQSEAALVLAGTPARIVVPLTDQPERARAALSDVTASGARGTDLQAAVAAAARELAAAGAVERAIVVLTDCADHARANELRGAGDTAVHVECLGQGASTQNAYVEQLELEPHDLDARFATVQLGVRSNLERDSVDVVFLVDEREVGRETVDIGTGRGSVRIDLDVRDLERARRVRAKLLVEDALSADNTRDLSVGSGAGLQVLLVDGDPAPNQLDDELRFVAVALGLPPDDAPPLRVRRVDPEGLSNVDLEILDVVLLANVPVPNESDANRLAAFVERGGGLWIAAGDQVDAFAYRERLGPLLPAFPRSAAEAKPPLGVRGGSARGQLAAAQVGLETAQTSRRLLLERPAEDSEVLLRFEDGTPALVMGRYGRGKTLLCTTTVDDDWSDLPLTPGFLPLVHATVQDLAPLAALAPGPRPAGEPVVLGVPPGTERLELVKPDAHRVALELDGDRAVFRETALPGLYRTYVTDGSGPAREISRLRFSVVPPARESVLLPGQGPSPTETAATGEAQAVARHSWAPWVWLLLGLVGLAEGLMRLRRPRETAAAQA